MNLLEKIRFALKYKQGGIHLVPSEGKDIDSALEAAKIFLDNPKPWNAYILQESLKKIGKY